MEINTSSMIMDIKAITETLKCLQQRQCIRAVMVTDSINVYLKKVQKELFYAGFLVTLRSSSLEKLTWIFSPGHAEMACNYRVDDLADSVIIYIITMGSINCGATSVRTPVRNTVLPTHPVNPARKGDTSR